MLCPLCYGRGLLIAGGQVVPCPECAGQGIVHCCDGLSEQPEEVPLPDGKRDCQDAVAEGQDGSTEPH